MKMARLGVNIDHVATLRQARGEFYPSLAQAANSVIKAGADQITIHLREDRRHIQDFDVPIIKTLTKDLGIPLNLEMGANEDIFKIAVLVQPEWICLVPEKREERTTEGGLDLIDENNFNRIYHFCTKLKSDIKDVKISLFVEASSDILDRCIQIECIDAVEIHTGDYARDFLAKLDTQKYFEKYIQGYEKMKNTGISFHAGHGLTDESVKPLIELDIFEEYNIGHWIICQSLFEGLESTVTRLKKIILKENLSCE